jgi:hypothetical protein
MAPAPFICTVWRDRDFQWLLGPKRVETFTTTLDLSDPRSLDRALLGAARRDAGDEADLDLYRLEVQSPAGAVLQDWRYNAWEEDAAVSGYPGYPYDVSA